MGGGVEASEEVDEANDLRDWGEAGCWMKPLFSIAC